MARRAAAALGACVLALGAGAADLPSPMGSTPQPAASPAGAEGFDVGRLFATTCGWCHSSGGRAPGRGPQLMGTRLTDAEIIGRIKSGKTGAMPSFATAFNDDQLQAIVRYIRALKPEEAAQ